MNWRHSAVAPGTQRVWVAYQIRIMRGVRNPPPTGILVAPGERTLGKETFEEDIGDFWAILETRPYMRARLGLAQCLYAVGRKEEGAAHYREMLRLNPNDNQDVRDLLAVCLLEIGQDEGLEQTS